MKITKQPFCNHVYAISHPINLTDSVEQETLKNWLQPYNGKWRVVGAGLIEFLDSNVEVMFILKWIK